MPKPKPMIYPYSRISSAKQAKGQGLAMQQEEELLEKLKERYGMEIYGGRMVDSGKSAFHGKHIADGQLGWFLAAVQSGEVAPGSILVVSSLDRFSRQQVRRASRDLVNVLDAEVGVYSVYEGRCFCDPKGNRGNDSADIQYATAVLDRANNESATKQARTHKIRDLAIARHLRGERHESGFAYSIKVVGNDVWWVDNSDGVVRPHEQYAPLAKQIALRLIARESPLNVTKWLNTEGITCPINRSDKKAKGAWSHHVIRRFHLNRALMGEKRINQTVLDGYYPAVLTEDEYLRLVHARTCSMRPKSSGRAKVISLFAGVEQVQCRHCGAGVHLNSEAGGYVNYRCSGFKTELACPGWSKRARDIESALLSVCLAETWKDPEQLPSSRVPVIQGEIYRLQASLDNLVEMARDKGFPKILISEIADLEAKIERLDSELEQARVEEVAKQVHSAASIRERWKAITDNVLDPTNDESRHHMRELLRDSIKSFRIGRPSYMGVEDRENALKAREMLDAAARGAIVLEEDERKFLEGVRNSLFNDEGKSKGHERFTVVLEMEFINGTRRVVTIGRNGPIAVAGIEREQLPPEVKAQLGEAPASLFNTYAPISLDDEVWLQEEFKGFPTNRETSDQ
ncbi:recombinase family protein [Aeromonas veronii]|uniref:recombinase family protein n=1 Tax=Aeromonas veronii TaxID=654 RepID=UPI003D1C1930